MVLKANYVNGETLTASVFNEVASEVNANTSLLSPATAANTANALVRRDASGNFSAGTVTASRLVSNVATGTAPLTVTSTTVVANLNASQLQGFVGNAGAVASTLALRGATGAVTGSQLVSTVATGTAPLTVTSTTVVANLNASQLNNLSANGTAIASSIAARDANANLLARGFISGFTTTVTGAGTTTLTILTAASFGIQQFTGTTTQTCVLPTTGIVAGQTFTIINNSTGAVTVQSSALAAIGAALTTGTSAEFIALVATPTTAANWHRR